jgi:Uncharacterized low-complexity proteins
MGGAEVGSINFKKIRNETIHNMDKFKRSHNAIYHYQLNRSIEKEKLEIGNADINIEDYYYIDEREQISFIKIKNKTIANKYLRLQGRQGGHIRITDQIINFNQYENCFFSHIKFINCKFSGSTFKKCHFDNVIFTDCSFEQSFYGPKELPLNSSTYFYECDFRHSIFVNCMLCFAIFEQSDFSYVSFENTDLSSAIFFKPVMTINICEGTNLSGTKFISPVVNSLNLENLNKLIKFNEDTFLDKINFHESYENFKYSSSKDNRVLTFQRMEKTYYMFAEQFRKNEIMYMYGEYFYLSKKTQLYYIKNINLYMKNLFTFITCGYGERPALSLVTSLAIIFICSILYMCFGISVEGRLLKYDLLKLIHANAGQVFNDFVICLHFSLVTFSTTGYGNIIPRNFSMLVSSFEMILGVIMIAIWTSTLVRKMTR